LLQSTHHRSILAIARPDENFPLPMKYVLVVVAPSCSGFTIGQIGEMIGARPRSPAAATLTLRKRPGTSTTAMCASERSRSAGAIQPIPIRGALRCGFYPGSHPREHQSGTAATFDQVRADFEAAWRVFLSKRTEADFQEWRKQRDWTARKYAMWEAGERLPSQRPTSIMRCTCGDSFDSHRLEELGVRFD
jgi:hypothetical protein